jgi:peptide/nickel transport system substrate-binding protein
VAAPAELLTRRVLAQHGLRGMLLLSASGLLADPDAAHASVAPPADGEIASLDWILPLEPVTLDHPHAVDGGSYAIVPHLLESLFAFDADGTMRPRLATAYRVVDPRTLVLSIREGVRFHDGSLLSAEDVAFSLGRHLDEQVGSYFAQSFEHVQAFEVTGAHELTVRLSEPDAGVLPALGTVAGLVGSRAFVERHGERTGSPTVGILGTGPYRFVSWQPGRRVVLERFEGYWNRERLALGVARFTGHVIGDIDAQLEQLRAGEMDGMDASGCSRRQLLELVREPHLTARTVSIPAAVSLFLNVARPPFDDVRVRRAMAHAIDRRRLLASVQGGLGALVDSVATPSSWGYERERFEAAYDALERHEHDLERARRLVEEAGARGARGELWAVPMFEALAQGLQRAGAEVGLDLTVRVVDIARFTRESTSPRRPYAAIVSLYSALYPDPGSVLRDVCSTKGIGNVAGYGNRRVDATLALQSTLTTDPGRRAALLAKAQAQVAQDLPVIPLWTLETPILLSRRIAGWDANPYDGGFIAHLHAAGASGRA